MVGHDRKGVWEAGPHLDASHFALLASEAALSMRPPHGHGVWWTGLALAPAVFGHTKYTSEGAVETQDSGVRPATRWTRAKP